MLFWASLAAAATLQDAWAAAESRGIEAEMIEQQRRVAASVRGAAWSLVAPKVVARGSYTRNDEEITFDPSGLIPEEFASIIEPGEPLVMRKLEYADASVSIVQPLIAPSAVAQIAAAGSMARAAGAVRDANLAALREGVASVYWGVLVARQAGRIAGGAVESASRHLELARRRVDVGSAPPQALLQAELALSRARRDAARAEEGGAVAELALERLTGWPPGTELALPAQGPLGFESAEAAVQSALASRPDVKAAALRASAARSAAWGQHLSWLPDVDGRFTYAWTGNTSAFSDKPELWMLVLESEWVIWDGGYRLSEQARVSAEQRLATLALQQAEATAAEAARVAYLASGRAEQAHEATAREVRLAEENARLAEVAYETGSLTFLELEDARLGLGAAQLAELEAQAARELALIALREATGSL